MHDTNDTPQQPIITEESNTGAQMPQYQCHKRVWALKIAEVRDTTRPERESDGSRLIVPSEEGFAPFRVKYDYVRKHNPQAGGYYVVYEDGYTSYSPAEPFESGYTRIQ